MTSSVAVGLRGLLLLFIPLGGVFASISAYYRGSTGAYDCAACRDNLRIIAIGLMNYYDVNGAFPPTNVCASDGTPIHSWRALIAPLMLSAAPGCTYSFREPWDSEGNLKAARSFAARYAAFRCPSSGRSGAGPAANYFLVSDDGSRRQQELRDGDGGHVEQTVLVVESTMEVAMWSEPRELPLDVIAASTISHCGGRWSILGNGQVVQLCAIERRATSTGTAPSARWRFSIAERPRCCYGANEIMIGLLGALVSIASVVAVLAKHGRKR